MARIACTAARPTPIVPAIVVVIEGWFVYSVPLLVVAVGAVIVGVQQTIRGIRGRRR